MTASIRPTTGATVCTDEGIGGAISTDDVVATPSYATSVEDTLGVASLICPAGDVPAYADDSSSHVVSTYDVTVVPGHATPATGVLNTPSTTCPPIAVVVDYAYPVDPVVAPVTLLLAFGTAPDGSWRARRRA